MKAGSYAELPGRLDFTLQRLRKPDVERGRGFIFLRDDGVSGGNSNRMQSLETAIAGQDLKRSGDTHGSHRDPERGSENGRTLPEGLQISIKRTRSLRK